MIEFLEPYFSHNDDRGGILGLCNRFCFEEINLITSLKGVVRGRHYHKHTNEMFIIIDGKIKITLFDYHNPHKRQEYIVVPPQCFYIRPFVIHTFEMLEDSKWINALDHKMTKKNQDFHTI